jgi:hypothetical protein
LGTKKQFAANESFQKQFRRERKSDYPLRIE